MGKPFGMHEKTERERAAAHRKRVADRQRRAREAARWCGAKPTAGDADAAAKGGAPPEAGWQARLAAEGRGARKPRTVPAEAAERAQPAEAGWQARPTHPQAN